MIRKLLVVAAAAALPVTVIAASGATAGAKAAPKVDATNYTVSCTGITGSASFSPPLTISSSGAETTKIKGSLSGCTATPSAGGTPIAITGAKVSGSFSTTTSTGCAGLLGSTAESGSLTVKWKASPALAASSSVIPIASVTGGATSDLRASFMIPGAVPGGPATGPFQGTNSGASDATSATSTQTEAQLTTLCLPGGTPTKPKPAKGIKKINLTVPESGPAVTLG